VVSIFRIGVGQVLQLFHQLFQQLFRRFRLADHVTHLLLHVHRLGERAQVQANDGLFHPVNGVGDDHVAIDGTTHIALPR
jgi:hypothetical protein